MLSRRPDGFRKTFVAAFIATACAGLFASAQASGHPRIPGYERFFAAAPGNAEAGELLNR